jgi:hydrogenase maturation protease
MRPVTVLVCGDTMRGDDGVGAAIVDALAPTTEHLATVRHVGGLMPDDLVDVEGPVIIVDAACGPPPGEVVDLPLDAIGSTSGPVGIGSSHAIPLPAVLEMARAMSGGHLEGRFVGIAGSRWQLGQPLSAEVRAALPAASAHLAHWIRVLAHAPPPEVRSCA